MFKKNHVVICSIFLTAMLLNRGAFADPPPIKLGASLALSDKLAFIGKSELAALKVATEDINARGGINGRQLKLIVENNHGEARSAISGIEKLTTINKVDLLFTAFTHIIEATRPAIEKSGVVTIYHASTDKPVQTPNRIFKDYGDAALAGKFTAESAVAKGYKNVAILSEISDVCNIDMKEFRSGFESADRTIGVELTYNPGEADFRPLLTRIKVAKPDAIVMCIWRDPVLVMKQLREIGMLSIPTLHFHSAFLAAAHTPEAKQIYEDNKALSTWYGFTEADATANQKKILERIVKELGEPRAVVPDAAMVYDDVMALAEAAGKCMPKDAKDTKDNIDSACVASELSKLTYQGLTGPLRFGEKRASVRPVFWIAVKDGEWQRQ